MRISFSDGDLDDQMQTIYAEQKPKVLNSFHRQSFCVFSSSISYCNERAISFATQSNRRNFIVHVTAIYHKNAIWLHFVLLSDGEKS